MRTIIILLTIIFLYPLTSFAITKDELCKFFIDSTLNEQFGSNKNESSPDIIKILSEYYGEPVLLIDKSPGKVDDKYLGKIYNDYEQCLLNNGFKHFGGEAYTYNDNLYTGIMGNISYILGDLAIEKYFAKENEKRNARIQEQQKQKAEKAKQKKQYRQQVCQKMMSNLGLSNEEFQYLTPFSYNLGEYICLGAMGQNLVKFSKPGLFDKTYTAVYEFPGGKELTLKFKHDDNPLFQQEAKKNIPIEGTFLNVEISVDDETLKPKAFQEAMMMLMEVTNPIVSMAAMRYPDFREIF